MTLLLALAPLWLAFEILQLVFCERILGLKQIQADQDPRSDRPGALISTVWVVLILTYGAWMISLFTIAGCRAQAAALLGISAVGYALRSNCTLKWILVILTFEGSLRVGMLVSLSAFAWRNTP